MIRALRGLLLLGMFCALLWPWGLINSYAQGGPVSCASVTEKEDFVSRLLPSVSEFELFDLVAPNPLTLLGEALSGFASAAGESEISLPVGRSTDNSTGAVTTEFRTVVLNQWSFLREASFEVRLNGGPLPSGELPDPPISLLGERTFRGRIDGYPNSLAALYIQHDRMINGDWQPGFISGFLLEDKDDPDSDWYFIEPVRPLLKMAVADVYKNPGVTHTDADIDACFNKWRYTHIVYKAGNAIVGRPLSFRIDLDPVRHTEETGNQHVRYKRTAPLQVVANRFIQHGNQDHGVVVEITTIRPLAKLNVAETLPAGFKLTPTDIDCDGAPVNRLAPNEFFCTYTNLHAGEEITITYKAKAGPTPSTCDFQDIQMPGPTPPTSTCIRGTAVSVLPSAVGETLTLDSPLEVVSVPPVSWAKLHHSKTIPLVATGDSSFYDLYTDVIEEKAWWEGQEEVLNLADAFYRAEVPGLEFRVRGLEAWSPPLGPGSTIEVDVNPEDGNPDINVYTLLCHFAQDFPPPAVEHIEGSAPVVVHLFSGHDLGNLPSHEAVADVATHYCEDNCGGFGSATVGMAEGRGGFNQGFDEPAPTGCASSFEDSPYTPDGFAVEVEPPGHHSLSQQAPKPNEDDPDAPVPPNENFQATLYQRFLLVAHEIGHSLGASHVDDDMDEVELGEGKTSMMHSHLSNNTEFWLHSTSRGEIIAIICIELGC